jgi:hypothetical protein
MQFVVASDLNVAALGGSGGGDDASGGLESSEGGGNCACRSFGDQNHGQGASVTILFLSNY